jgi:diazepam-binding inhibitor (GABA receptor modulating acyl-CoA-binding protein)
LFHSFCKTSFVVQERFDKAAAEVKNLPQRPTNDELLLLYGLYKQATVGDNNTSMRTQFQLQ